MATKQSCDMVYRKITDVIRCLGCNPIRNCIPRYTQEFSVNVRPKHDGIAVSITKLKFSMMAITILIHKCFS